MATEATNRANQPVAYLNDSLVNFKPAHELRRILPTHGIACLPARWDVNRDRDGDGWSITRERSFNEVEEDIRLCGAMICGYPNWTATGRRAWFEAWTAKENKIPLVVAKYASRTEQAEYRSLLAGATWINTRSGQGHDIKPLIDAVQLVLQPATIQYEIQLPPPKVLVASHAYWQVLLDELVTDFPRLHGLPPRAFEELVAHLLERDGYTVELTPETRDGGRDILAYKNGVFANNLFLVECKRYAPQNPVGIGMVQRLYGVLQGERATAAALVTTSSFTRDAVRWSDPLGHQLTLRDFEFMKVWVTEHAQEIRSSPK